MFGVTKLAVALFCAFSAVSAFADDGASLGIRVEEIKMSETVSDSSSSQKPMLKTTAINFGLSNADSTDVTRSYEVNLSGGDVSKLAQILPTGVGTDAKAHELIIRDNKSGNIVKIDCQSNTSCRIMVQNDNGGNSGGIYDQTDLKKKICAP